MPSNENLTDVRFYLARKLHESGRKAVEARKIYRSDLPVKPFAEWDELDDATIEGRLMMADYMIANVQGLYELIDGIVVSERDREHPKS